MESDPPKFWQTSCIRDLCMCVIVSFEKVPRRDLWVNPNALEGSGGDSAAIRGVVVSGCLWVCDVCVYSAWG